MPWEKFSASYGLMRKNYAIAIDYFIQEYEAISLD
jgi:hypothetical protein